LAEAYGEIYSKEEAEQKYGKVTEFIDLQTKDIKQLAQTNPDGLMFKLVDSNVIALNKQRDIALGSYEVSSDEVFNHLSTSVLNELLEKGGKETTSFQMRGETFTIQNGDFVLQGSYPCPPFC